MIGRRQGSRQTVADRSAPPGAGSPIAEIPEGPQAWLPEPLEAPEPETVPPARAWVPDASRAAVSRTAGLEAASGSQPAAWLPAGAAALIEPTGGDAAAPSPQAWRVGGASAQAPVATLSAGAASAAWTASSAASPLVSEPPQHAADTRRVVIPASAALRFGLPALVVTASIGALLAIAGVFGSPAASRPHAVVPSARATAPRAAHQSSNSANGAVRPARHAAPRHTRQASRRRNAPHATATTHNVSRAAPARPGTPIAARPAPVTRSAPPAPAPSPVHRVAPKRTTALRPISKTRPTQRSGSPGRQPISG